MGRKRAIEEKKAVRNKSPETVFCNILIRHHRGHKYRQTITIVEHTLIRIRASRGREIDEHFRDAWENLELKSIF